jgi:hypothetical protein
MLRLRTYALAVAVALPSLVACGGDDGGNNTPDAPPADTGRSCDAATPTGALAVFDGTDESFVAWSQPVTVAVAGADQINLNFEFYSGIESSLSGALDLTAGNQNNYATCAACVRIAAFDADGNLVKEFFQDGGTLNLTEDPFTNGKLVGTADDVSLVEVSINRDDQSYTSTPVSGGVCLTLGALTLNADSVPVDWTCAKEAFNDGASCDCACGAHDPDCDIDDAPVVGCTGAQVCGSDDTCIDLCNVLSTPPETCPTGVCGYQTADQDICYTDTTLVDPAALGSACASADQLFCAVDNTVATGLCDSFQGDDLQCRKACDAAADCANGQVCAGIVGAKGLCITPPTNDTCATPEPLTLGTAKTGTTGGATSDYDAGLEADTCTGYPQKGADVVYSVVLEAGTTYTVTVSNASAHFDPSVAIVGPGDAATVCGATLACKAGADAGLTAENETFNFAPTEAGTYFVIVDSFVAGQGGSFTLTVAAQP